MFCICPRTALRLSSTASCARRTSGFLTTRHARFAHGDALARRYLGTISPIGALSGVTPAHVAALEALVDVDDDVGLIGPNLQALPANWENLYASRLFQMIRPERSPLP